MTKQREAFERWQRDTYDTSLFTITQNGEYASRELQYDWLAWQAAQADKMEFAMKAGEAITAARGAME